MNMISLGSDFFLLMLILLEILLMFETLIDIIKSRMFKNETCIYQLLITDPRSI